MISQKTENPNEKIKYITQKMHTMTLGEADTAQECSPKSRRREQPQSKTRAETHDPCPSQGAAARPQLPECSAIRSDEQKRKASKGENKIHSFSLQEANPMKWLHGEHGMRKIPPTWWRETREGQIIPCQRPFYGPTLQEETPTGGTIIYPTVGVQRRRRLKKRFTCPTCRETGEGHAKWCQDPLKTAHDREDEQGFREIWTSAGRDPPHADLLDTDVGSIHCMGVKGTAHKRAYAIGQAFNTQRGIQKPVKIMVDNGNLVKTGVAVSEEFMRKMALGYSTLGRGTVPTAGKGQGMTNLGISQSFSLKIQGMKKTYEIKALVCKELSDDINIGTGFLQQISKESMTNPGGKAPCLHFYQDGVTLTAGGCKIPLVQTLGDTKGSPDEAPTELSKEPEGNHEESGKDSGNESSEDHPHQSRTQSQRATDKVKHRRPKSIGGWACIQSFPLHAREDTLLKGNSLTFVKTQKIPAATLVEAVNINGEGYVKAIPAVYQQHNQIGLLNLGDTTTVKKGTQIGQAVPTKIRTEPKPTSKPGIHAMATDNGTLFKELQLEENEILQDNPRIKAQVETLISEYKDVFSNPEQTIGRTDLIEFKIELEPGAQPKKAKTRPLNPAQKKSLQAQIDLWKKEDIIEESSSPWASAMVPVLKKNGELRWAVDYRALNKVTVKDSYPLPCISENLDKLQGSTVFSCLDAAGAYHTIPVEEKSRPLLSFTTPMGLFQYRRMPFGPANSGQCYSRFMETMIDKLRSPWVLCYLDDIIVHSRRTASTCGRTEKSLTNAPRSRNQVDSEENSTIPKRSGLPRVPCGPGRYPYERRLHREGSRVASPEDGTSAHQLSWVCWIL